MAESRFPDPREATPDGVVAVGGRPEPELLAEAYARGIFPWPVDGYPLLWFSPPERGILFFEELHLPRSLVRERRRTRLTFTIDRAFERVIRACATVSRAHEQGTWIKSWMIRGYCEFHRRGRAHSVEAWEGGELVGGLYGVAIGRMFYGESMFSRETDASKVALVALVRELQERKFPLIDCQMHTPLLASLGGREIPRRSFLRELTALVNYPQTSGKWDVKT